eukprot:TRINITY_DN1566_c0_g4_i1.p1 TRINITY_DN1566_c0_g4~~TRINITY_DN1566_c0_g4_i1.p1  ORF type:complete len:461 (-),score=54.35 TRINITY_DN1566_c0_g4_i1:48-1430(-)
MLGEDRIGFLGKGVQLVTTRFSTDERRSVLPGITANLTDSTGANKLQREYIPAEGEEEAAARKHGCWRWFHSGVCCFSIGCSLRPDFLKYAGIKLSKSGRSVFNYDPRKVTRFMTWVGLAFTLPPNFNRWWYFQLLCMWGLAGAYFATLSDTKVGSRLHGMMDDMGVLDSIVVGHAKSLKDFSTFILGLYISLALAQTYYKNRGVFGTVFGSSLGFSQMAAAWIRPPVGRQGRAQSDAARGSQELLIRWNNAAYRLLVLEVLDTPAEEIGDDLVTKREMLTEAEWKSIAKLPSRATHIYQWMNNVLWDLMDGGYLPTRCMITMQEQVDMMRGANVWGLPSLPLPYTMFVTVVVKMFMFAEACHQGVLLAGIWPDKMATGTENQIREFLPMLSLMWNLFLVNLLFQGALDLHGWIYSPNGGEYLGHLPAENFLAFVQKVCVDMLAESGAISGKLPYKSMLG